MKLHSYFIYCLLLLGAFNIAHAADEEFPSGNSTPEGIAADLARVFINSDVNLFINTCIPPFGGGKSKTEYESFMAHVQRSIVEESNKTQQSPFTPKRIVRIYKARRLSTNGPVSYGHSAFGFEDIQFVDVDVELRSGEFMNNRTMVIKHKNRWFVHPLPQSSPLLSEGLNEESDSIDIWVSSENDIESDSQVQ